VTSRFGRGLFGALLALALVASACGSDEDDATPTTTAPPKQSVVTTQAPEPTAPVDAGGLDELNVAYFLEWPTANQVAQVEMAYDNVLGVPVNWVSFASGNDMALAMEAGDIDISYSQGLTPFANYVTSGADHVIVGVAVSYADADNCVAHPDYAVSQDNAAEALAGQSIYTPIGNVTHFKLLKMLEHLGVSLDDVSLIPSEGGPAAVAAFENGDVAMACAFGGAINTMLAAGGNLVMTGAEQEALGIRVFDIISAPRNFAEAHPSVVTAFLQVTEDANGAYAANRASTEATIAEAAGMDVEGSNALLDAFTFLDRDSQLSEAWLGGTVQAAMKEQMDFFVAQGEIDTALDSYDGVVDTSYLEAVVGRGFGAANPQSGGAGGMALPDLGGREVTIAVDNAYLPFAYIPADTGVATGWDYDAMDEVCARLNCVPSFQEFAWDGTIIATGEGQFDMAGGGITITEERDEVVDFSISFISTDQKILVAKGSTEIGSRDDLAASDCSAGSMTGTTNYDLTASITGEDRIVAFESFAFAVQALITGDVCAVIMDDVAGQGYQGENADQVDLLPESLQSDPLGWAFTEGSDLVPAFNAAIQSMKDDGTLAALNGKYFGTAFTITYDDIGDGAYAEPDDGGGDAGAGLAPTETDLTMCRANWASGYVQAEIVRQVLQSAGYSVSDPAAIELGPANAYTTMAEGTCHLWANSWYPTHFTWYQNELPDGSLVADHVEPVDGLFQDSGVQGFLVTKSWADAEGITTVDQVNDTPALYEALDTDGDGKGEILGCPEDWTCDDTMESMIAFAGWDNLVQTKAGYDAMFAEFMNRVRDDEPAIIYTWTPSAYVVEMVPGVDVYWLSIEEESLLDDSNPLGVTGGESHAQEGFTDAPADTCTQPCQLGFDAADIQVSARIDLMAADPYLKNLLESIVPSIIDISILQVEQANGDGSEAHVQQLAAGWMDANADLVAGWVAGAATG